MKRRKNNKGFTLVEILAAVTIMGILAAIAIPAVYRYVTKSRDLSYDSMYNSVYDAVKNYRINTNDDTFKGRNGPTYSRDEINKLIEWKYLEPLIDPADREKQCTSEVYIYNCIDSSELDTLNGYLYTVMLKCSAHSGSKTFDDTGELLSNSEQNKCLGISDFVVDEENIKMKYVDKDGNKGKDYYGDWTNQNVWIGNVSTTSDNKIKKYQYTFDINNPLTENFESFDSDTGYTFKTDINKEFRIRAVDVDENVGAWSEKIYRVRIDKTPPDVTMAIINSNNNFEKTFTGTATDNSYTHATWVGKSSNAIPNVRISAKDTGAGVDSSLTVNYNISGASTFSDENIEKWNGASGNKSFNKSNTFTANGLDDGYRVVNCTVKDKAGNETTGTIKVMIDATPPTLDLKLISSSDGKDMEGYSYSCSNDKCEYTPEGWINKKFKDNISVKDNGSSIMNITAAYNEKNTTSFGKEKDLQDPVDRENGSSVIIGDGYRYIKYTATDNAGNISKLIFKIKVDKVPPVINATFYTENSKSLFEANSSSNANYTYTSWINSSKPIKKESIIVTDGVSGISNNNSKRKIFKGSSSYSNASQTNSDTDTLKFSGTDIFKKSKEITHNSRWNDGYRVVKYLVYDKAGNSKELKVQFKVDTTPPTGSITVLNGTNEVKEVFDNHDFKYINHSVNVRVKEQDNFSGISRSVTIKFNDSNKPTCSYDDSTLTGTSTYNFKDWTANSKSGEITQNNLLKDGCRYLKLILSDVAGNERTIKIKMDKEADTNTKDGCHYVDLRKRCVKDMNGNTFSWGKGTGYPCSGEDGPHTKAYYVVCRNTDKDGNVKYYDARYYWRTLKGKTEEEQKLPALYICPNVTVAGGKKILSDNYTVLTAKQSARIIWHKAYGFTASNYTNGC